MTYRSARFLLVVLVVLVGGITPGSARVSLAQENTVIVPDVTGLNIPAAAAQFHRSGLALGTQTAEPWRDGMDQTVNTVLAQALSPGESVAPGTKIDVTVLRAPNARLVYNAQVVSLINGAATSLDLTGVEFVALDGATPARFPATNWVGTLQGGEHCVQLWAVRRTGPNRPSECTGLQRWLSTVNKAVHFWTGANGVTRFQVVQAGVVRAECEAAAPGEGRKQCAFFLSGAESLDVLTPYVYLAYTPHNLIILNQSEDRWMPLAKTDLFNYNPNITLPVATVPLGDPDLYNEKLPVANPRRPAPGECLLFTNSSPESINPPRACVVIARLDVDPRFIFWTADFEIGSATDGRRHTCPAAAEGKLTICIMPR